MNSQAEAILREVETIEQEFGLVSVAPQLDACRSSHSRTEVIEVVVFGRYKSGKSSFLNSLAGQTVLPVGVLPVTAILTRMKHGPEPSACVEFLDGHKTPIALQEIEQYVAEEKNPHNQKQVSAVHIELPSLDLYKGLEFVDTPGIGSLFRHNTEASLRWLPYASVALMLVSVDQPLSEEDIGFIQQLRRYTPRVIVVLTKADRIASSEIDKICAFSATHLMREFKAKFPVFPFCSLFDSAEPRSATWRTAVDDQLLSPLRLNAEIENKQIFAHKCRGVIDDCTNLLNIALNAAARSAEERERIKAVVFQEGQSLPLVQKEIRLLTYDLTSKMTDRLWRNLGGFCENIRTDLLTQFDRNWPGWRTNLWDLTRLFEQWLRDALADRLADLAAEERTRLLEPLKEAENGLACIGKGFLSGLAERVSRTMGTSITPQEHVLKITEPEAPDVSVGRVFDTPWEILWFIIPVPIFRPIIRRHFRRQINWEAEKHLARLAAQWSERINKTIERAAADEESYAQGQITTFHAMLSETDLRMPAIQRALDRLRTIRTAVDG
jgi:GTP-binding protein EngB required for normal cell division